ASTLGVGPPTRSVGAIRGTVGSAIDVARDVASTGRALLCAFSGVAARVDVRVREPRPGLDLADPGRGPVADAVVVSLQGVVVGVTMPVVEVAYVLRDVDYMVVGGQLGS